MKLSVDKFRVLKKTSAGVQSDTMDLVPAAPLATDNNGKTDTSVKVDGIRLRKLMRADKLSAPRNFVYLSTQRPLGVYDRTCLLPRCCRRHRSRSELVKVTSWNVHI